MSTSALANKVDLSLHAGNDVPITVAVTGNDGLGVWLDDWSSRFIISMRGSTSKKLTLERGSGIAHYPATNAINELIISIAAEDTRKFAGDYDYELKIMSPDEKEITAMYGKITFTMTADIS